MNKTINETLSKQKGDTNSNRSRLLIDWSRLLGTCVTYELVLIQAAKSLQFFALPIFKTLGVQRCRSLLYYFSAPMI